MKKCLCTFFICLFIFILKNNVYAYCPNIEGKILEKKTFYKYKYYNNENIFKYFKKNENSKEYPKIIEDDIRKSNFSNWSFNKEDNKNRIYEQRLVYVYREINNINYIFLKDFKGGYDKLYISEIRLVNGDKEISYDVECTNCSKDFDKYVKNGIEGENKSYVNKDSVLKLKINSKEKINDLEFHIYMYDEIDTEKHFKLLTTYEDNINDVYYEDDFTYYFHSSNDKDVKSEKIKLSSLPKVDPKFGEEKISLEPISETDDIKVEEKLQYRYKDILYKYMGIKKVYSSSYLDKKTKEYPLIDKSNKKEYEMCIWKDIEKREEDITKVIPKEDKSSIKKLDNKIAKENNIELIKKYDKISNISCNVEKEDIDKLNKKLLKCKNDKNIYSYFLLVILILLVYIICQKRKKEKKN